MKNPFKKSSIMDTLVNVGVGGAANVAMDYLYNNVEFLGSLGDTTKNAVKIAVGAIGGGMVSNKYVRAAADGIAVVGVSNLISGLMDGSDTGTTKTAGLPNGTIGRIRLGQRGFRSRRVAGVGDVQAFMGK